MDYWYREKSHRLLWKTETQTCNHISKQSVSFVLMEILHLTDKIMYKVILVNNNTLGSRHYINNNNKKASLKYKTKDQYQLTIKLSFEVGRAANWATQKAVLHTSLSFWEHLELVTVQTSKEHILHYLRYSGPYIPRMFVFMLGLPRQTTVKS